MRNKHHLQEIQEFSRSLISEMEREQGRCVSDLADEWRQLRDMLNTEQRPHGLNEVNARDQIRF